MQNKINNIERAVENRRALILDAERYVWQNPETGYREWKTNNYLKGKYTELGYELTEAGDVPGFYTEIDTGREGPCVLILGELDSVICPEHPESDRETGAVHACGHNAQSAALLGVAAALTDESVVSALCGKIRLCAVPAEELLEIEYRSSLRERGVIKYFGGKTEFLSRGYFDGVDMAFMVHTGANVFSVREAHVGCLAKKIIYKGKSSHAGGAPQLGNNALYAATCGLNAVNAIRETFRDSDHIRVHPIMTSGGQMVNAIPSRATLESYVRGRSFDAITKENKKVNRAFVGAALSLGTNIEILDYPGYSPEYNDLEMRNVARDAAALAVPSYGFKWDDGYSAGSTEMGDLSLIMPTVQPFSPGSKGTAHGMDYYIADPVAACVDNAKFQLAMLTLLLCDGAKRAKEIIEGFKPQFESKEAFLAYVDSLYDSGDRIEYLADGTAKVRI
ncbi:MAG: amidohydrolase [Clostridia bacterium]|nr:amidohydrolase [Clostridia bacterium]